MPRDEMDMSQFESRADLARRLNRESNDIFAANDAVIERTNVFLANCGSRLSRSRCEFGDRAEEKGGQRRKRLDKGVDEIGAGDEVVLGKRREGDGEQLGKVAKRRRGGRGKSQAGGKEMRLEDLERLMNGAEEQGSLSAKEGVTSRQVDNGLAGRREPPNVPVKRIPNGTGPQPQRFDYADLTDSPEKPRWSKIDGDEARRLMTLEPLVKAHVDLTRDEE